MKFFSNGSIIVVLAFLAIACNKSGTTDIISPGNNADSILYGKKVLLVTVDGLVGSELEKAAPVNITNYSKNAIFSYDAINTYIDDSIPPAYGWANIFTGVTAAKHNIRTADFAGANLITYPSFVTRLVSLKPQLKIAAVVAKQSLATNLLSSAAEKYVFENNDLSVVNKTSEIIRNGNPDLIISQLTGPDSAGALNAYVVSNSIYKSAVDRFDSYLGALVQAIRSRPKFASEDWMVIVASSKGSNLRYLPPVGGIWNAFDDKMHNTFVMYYNPRFVPNEFSRPVINPYIGNGYNFKSGNSNVANRSATANLPYSGTAFNTDKEFTIQCKVKLPKSANGTYGYISNGFLGFRNPSGNAANGVTFSVTGNRPLLMLRNAAGSGDVATIMGPTDVADNLWHTLTFVKRRTSGSAFSGTFYLDGANIGTVASITTSLSTAHPFCAGMLTHSSFNPIFNGTFATQAADSWATTQLNITDIRIYDTALAETYVSNSYCNTEVPLADPYYNNLLGFWKGDVPFYDIEEARFFLPDFSPRNNNPLYFLESNVTSNLLAFNDQTLRVCPPLNIATYRSLMNSVDISYQIYSWLGVSPSTSWGLDGKTLVPNYIDVSN